MDAFAERDLLTDLCSFQEAGRLVEKALAGNGRGMLLLIDIVRFGEVNEKIGHQAGDQILKKIANLLNNMLFSRDILARTGGSEFIVFSQGSNEIGHLSEKERRIVQRIEELGEQMETTLLAASVIVTAQRADRFQDLMDRARHEVRAKKQIQRKKFGNTNRMQTDVDSQQIGDQTIEKDLSMIVLELKENSMPQGAFCQDYDNFMFLYRFMKRGLARNKKSVYLILMTLTGNGSGIEDLALQEQLMDLLGSTVKESLRSGDVYTQYSSCQYLLMVLDLNYDNARMIVERIRKKMRLSALEFTASGIDCEIRPVEA